MAAPKAKKRKLPKTSRTIVSFGKMGKKNEEAISGIFERNLKQLGLKEVTKIPEGKRGIALQGSKGAKHFQAIVGNAKNKNKESALSVPLPGFVRNKEVLEFLFKDKKILAVVTPDGRRFKNPKNDKKGQ